MRGSLAIIGMVVPVVLLAGTAHADNHMTLPDGHGVAHAPDGVSVDVGRTGEQATVSNSMADSPLSRTAWVSGVTTVHVDAPSGVTVTGGHIETGYLVGCQVDLGSAVHAAPSGDTQQTSPQPPGNGGAPGNSTGGNQGGDNQGGDNQGSGGGGDGGGLSVGNYDLGAGLNGSGVTPFADPDASIRLKPGKAATKKIQTYDFTGTDGVAQFVDHTISIDGCAGAAQARSYITITVHDKVMDSTITLWGRPFDLG
ncbi:MspA family porin [Nocardia nova]|uniref:MspA family porin n=1 Tax=Nocardia nova TaxID=37330 RepID=UPI0033EC5C98